MTNKIFSSLKVIALAVVLSFGLSYVYAWTAPTVAPTGGNVSAPLNTSATTQTKAGSLVLDLTSKTGAAGRDALIINASTDNANGVILANKPEIAFWNTIANTPANIYAKGAKFDGNVGIGTPAPLRALHVNGEFSLSRSDNVGFINISNESGNGGGMLYLRGLDNGGATEAPATIILKGTTYANGSLYVNGTPVTGSGIDYGNCVTITHSEGAKGANCGGVTVQENSADCTVYPNYVMVSNSTGLRYPGQCTAAVAKCCKLK